MKALNDILVLIPQKKENTTKGGLILATSKKEFLETAKVVSVGEGVEGIEQGDDVVYKNAAPIEYNKDNKTYLIITKYDVFLNLSK